MSGSDTMDGVWLLVPARGGSKGIRGKNLRSLAGRPLVMHVLDELSRLVPRTESKVKGTSVVEERRYDPRRRRIEKTIRCGSFQGSPAPLELLESVRAYAPEELADMLRRAGLAPAERFGDLRGAPFDARNSPRCVLVGRKGPA